MKLLLALVTVFACTPRESGPPPKPKAPSVTTIELLGSMARLAGFAAEPSFLGEWARTIDAEPARLSQFIDTIVEAERFADEIVPALLFGSFATVRNYYALPSAFVLKQTARGSFFLRAPCSEDETRVVQPWWDLTTSVRVCPDAYRQDKWLLEPGEHDYQTQIVLSCDSQVGSPELERIPLCGCGPNLIRCARDGAHYEELNTSLMREITTTTAYVVRNDLPLASLFTGNATFRDRNAEAYYRRQRIGSLRLKQVRHELSDLAAWPAEGQWAPRAEVVPGQHAGVLTAPQILHWLPDRRQRQRGYYEILWCNLRNSFGASTAAVLELNASGNNFFLHDSWKRLAHTELCTNCHARLDYGSQFFRGYPDSRASTHFYPPAALDASGPLYGRDIEDHRGDARLTPVGFAKLATEQPEFGKCISNHISSYVLADGATVDDARAIEAAFEQSGTVKHPMRVALERYAARWRKRSREPSTSLSFQAIDVSAALRSKLEDHCIECHGEGSASGFALELATALPRGTLVRMADLIAFGLMPKDESLDPGARTELVRLVIANLWSEPSAQLEAERYYLGRARGMPAHQIDNTISMIKQVAGASSQIDWGSLERGLWSDQLFVTPGFLALTGLEALYACRAGSPDALERCLDRSTAWPMLSRNP